MARRILGGAIVPAAPALLPAVSPRQPEEVSAPLATLRDEVRQTLRALPESDVVVVLDAGTRGIHQRAVADLTSIGAPTVRAELPVPSALTSAVTRITQYPLLATDRLPLSAAVLVLLLHDARGAVPTVVATVPGHTEGELLSHVGAGLVEAVRGIDATGVIVATGDLSAALTEESPGYRVDGAGEWDRQLVQAVANHDAPAVHALGPEGAREVGARSWPAIVAGTGAAAAARVRSTAVTYCAPLGVGQLVARFEPAESAEPGERFRRDTTA